MSYSIEREVARFENWGMVSFPSHRIERLCEFGWLLRPKENSASSLRLPPGKNIALTLTGLIHGNEVAGSAVLNATLAHLASGAITAPMPIAFILGNPWAAQQGRRFLERDLNRSFARADSGGILSQEDRRAKVLEKPLAETAYILDFHQTMRRSEHPFFIFPHTASSFAWARRMAPRISIVTHWGKPFSSEGRCSDEFVNVNGGIGVTLELGQNGFDPYQIGAGTSLALAAIRCVLADLCGQELKSYQVAPEEEGDIYTWAEIYPWPPDGFVELCPDWHNFKPVAAGETLGIIAGLPLQAKGSGWMLFPKYLTVDEQKAQVSRPTELCRVMKKIEAKDLPST